MAESLHALTVAVGLLFMVCASGAALALGISATCRWMKWSPVNITFNVYRVDDRDT